MNKKDIDINDERAVRMARLENLKITGIDPYPARSERTHSMSDACTQKHGVTVCIAGRVVRKRDMGKMAFVQLMDETGTMQLVMRKEILGDSYNTVVKKIDIGDIIEAKGERVATKTGEESVMVAQWTLLSKSLLPLPDKFHGLQDEELRLRKRYLDLIIDPELRKRFRRKALFWQATRSFLNHKGFLEVETPVLETTAGGADATPFLTHHNALDLDVYLRISMGELWQKRLMVGGFEKTFEIGRQFRNEGMSREHLQDYSQMEFYIAYADYTVGMVLVEELFKHILKETFSTLTFDIGDFKKINISKQWEQIEYVDEVKRQTGVDVLIATDDELRKVLSKVNQSFGKQDSRGRLIDSLWKHCRKQIKGPAFLVHHPVSVSPLAKRKVDNKELTERYQIIIAGSELGNGYSELNDPLDQAERFEIQARMREEGDTEAQMHDKDFVEALEHGMPPTTGFGFSERVFSFFENAPIRECVLFPLMKPMEQGTRNKEPGTS